MTGLFEGLVDFLFGNGAVDDTNDVSQRTGDSGNPESITIKFTLKVRDDFGGGEGGAGGGRDDVGGGGAGPAEVAMRVVLEILVVGVGVDSGHEGFFNPELRVDDFDDGRDAVGGAGGVGEDGFVLRFSFLVSRRFVTVLITCH